ncbi:MAG TPA: DUF4907 domain-containing protein [Bacteroidales bacterium]|nr:DUF4907 domain-containing protein [Bacteroidales bacterium]
MMKVIQMTKQFLLVGSLFLFAFVSCQTKKSLKVESFVVDEGWGYKLVFGKKTIIYQTNIPAIQNQQTFHSERDALVIGYLVKEKLLHNQIPPTVSLNELASAKVQIMP